MITISRRYWGIKVENVYFPTNEELERSINGALVGITQASNFFQGLYPLETLQIDLNRSEEELLAGMKKSTRQQIRQAENLGNLVHQISCQPTNSEIYSFRDFYNKFADVKNTYRCSSYNLKTLQLLRDKNSLIITDIIDELTQEILCYRVYVYDHIRVTPLYSVSHHSCTDDPKHKRLLSLAHRLLKWKDMLWLKGDGCQIYDNGGLTNNQNIRKYKMEFGGTVLTEYSGYMARGFLGKVFLIIRKLFRRT